MSLLSRLGESVISIRKRISAQTLQVGIIAAFFIALACFVSIHLLYDSYHAYALDLGLFTQTLKYTLDGHLLFHTIGGLSHLAYHSSPILLFLAPIYWIFPYAQTLLVVQAVIIGLSGCLIYYIARSYKLSHRASIFFELLFFVNPLVWGLVLFDFHEVVLAIPCLLVMFIGMRQKRWKLFAFGLIFTLMVKEDVTVTLGIFAAGLLFLDFVRNKSLNRQALIILISSLSAYGLGVLVSTIASGGSDARILSYFSVRYTYLELPVTQIVEGAVSAISASGSLILIWLYLAPLGFIPLLSLTWMVPVYFNLALNIFSTCPAQHHLQQSSTVALPFLFMAVFSGIEILRQRKDYQALQTTTGKILISVICLAMVCISVWITARPAGNINSMAWPNEHDKALDRLIELVPEGASVTANNNIFPHLVAKNNVYLPFCVDPFTPIETSAQWGFPDRDTDYIVVDNVYLQQYTKGFWEYAVADQIEQKYDLVTEIDGAKLYKLRETQ
jgi:uncharacterized membrane protein